MTDGHGRTNTVGHRAVRGQRMLPDVCLQCVACPLDVCVCVAPRRAEPFTRRVSTCLYARRFVGLVCCAVLWSGLWWRYPPLFSLSLSLSLSLHSFPLPNEIFIHKVRIKEESYMDSKCSMCDESKHEKECTTSTPKCANCKGEYISIDRSCLSYRKEYEIRKLMAYENLAMEDARKLVYKKPKIDFLPYKEVVRNFPNQCSNDKGKTQENLNKSNSNSRLHYKFQKANCEYFIDNRESLPSTNGAALRKSSLDSRQRSLKYDENLNPANLLLINSKATGNT
ncbi:hypothetical protein ALC53_04399 [Atta colombica]|uniref:Uncharacterized protein n=1 Tax=Atta colombica TaxID=520822 RepID=A0A195BLM2_9HYME|nr:hypothetical protein ALC53_04399 [Atta colombica]